MTVPKRIRATEDKVRQALFNILGSRVHDARVLDGFAGSGAIGLEALSRGARKVVFVESHPACLRAIRDNLTRIAPHLGGAATAVYRGDAIGRLRRLAEDDGPFDLVILDPPYDGPWGKKALNAAATCGILARTGLLCVEHARQLQVPSVVGPLALWKQHRYGDTVLSFYGAAEDAQP